MPSPFPGMDPFIESQAWATFRHGLIAAILEALTPQVRPRYVVRVEERVYLEHLPGGSADPIRPDLSVLREAGRERSSGGVATAVAIVPVALTLPMPEREREAFLSIRQRETMEVVCLIEALSPGNKRTGSDGRQEYLRKREGVLQSPAHLVEIDLLQAGERLPTIEPLPSADYYAFVSREQRRPQVEVYAWPLRHPLPSIPVPLAGQDPDAALHLQSIFSTVYDRAGYDYSLDYRRPVQPPLNEENAAWAQQLLEAASTPSR